MSACEDISEVVDELCNLLVAYGFHPNSIKKAILGKAEEYEMEEQDDKV